VSTLVELPGKIPPHNLEAERAILGNILLEPVIVSRAIEVLQPDEFYKDGHRKIYGAMVRLFERSEPTDVLTVTEELRRSGELDEVGGPATLATLMEEATVATQFASYAQIVRDKAQLRELIRVAREISEHGFEETEDVKALIDQAEQMVFRISERRMHRSALPVRDILTKTIEHIETLYRRKEHVTGVASGFRELDRLTAGFQKSDFVIIAGRPSMGKCLAFDSEILLEDGSVATVEALYRRGQARLLTLTDRWRFEVTQPSAFVDDGEKPVYRVTTRLGRRIEATLVHPFLTIEGWKPLGEIEVGTRVAVPRRLDVFGTEEMRDCEIKLLAYLLGDGGLTGTNPRFTGADSRLQDDFADAVCRFGGLTVALEDSPGTRTPYLSVRRGASATCHARQAFAAELRNHVSHRGARRRLAAAVGAVTQCTTGRTAPGRDMFSDVATALGVDPDGPAPRGHAAIATPEGNALGRWLERLGLWGRGAAEKAVPSAVFTLTRGQIALFLNRLFATDGWVTLLATGQAQAGYATTSERLARQVQHLLLRFGVIASLRRRRVRYGEGFRPAWQLDITGARSLAVLAREIGIFGKDDALARVVAAVEARRFHVNRSVIPREVWELLDLANSDVYWDEVVAIEAVGRKRVYDLTIPGTHNFVANDMCVHNTAFALNIAQEVAVTAAQPVLIFSLEMAKEQLVQRLLCAEARVDSHRVRTGYLESGDWKRIGAAAGRLADAPLFIDDTANLSVLEARAKARRIRAEHGLELVVIDYLQLMQGRWRAENRQQEISEISRSLKALAKELEVPVVALSQLSRAVEARGDGAPRLSDLRESGALEQDADVIVFLHRPGLYKENPSDAEKNLTDVIIGKQRNGPTDKIQLVFKPEYTRFEDRSSRDSI
jgi:replicative DNA helicase